LTFHILPGANFNRRSTRKKNCNAETVVRTRRRWSGEIGDVLGFPRRRKPRVKASVQIKEIAS